MRRLGLQLSPALTACVVVVACSLEEHKAYITTANLRTRILDSQGSPEQNLNVKGWNSQAHTIGNFPRNLKSTPKLWGSFRSPIQAWEDFSCCCCCCRCIAVSSLDAGRQPTERLAEYGWKPRRAFLAQKCPHHRPQFTGIRVKNRGVWIHRIRDLKLY